MFSCEFRENSKVTFSQRTVSVTASVLNTSEIIPLTFWIEYYSPRVNHRKKRSSTVVTPVLFLAKYILHIIPSIFVWDERYSKRRRSSHRRCSVRKVVPRNLIEFTGRHLCQSLFFNKVAGLMPQACNFIKKETLAQEVSSCEFCKISKNSFL